MISVIRQISTMEPPHPSPQHGDYGSSGQGPTMTFKEGKAASPPEGEHLCAQIYVTSAA